MSLEIRGQKALPVIKLAQYLSGVTAKQDVWVEAGKALVEFFGADLVAVGERRSEEILCRAWTLSARAAGVALPDGVAEEAIAEVLESGFLSERTFPSPEPLSVVFLPIAEENLVRAVMLVGHQQPGPLPRELLDVYLAVAGLVATTASRQASTKELRAHRERLEELVGRRTAELTATNEALRLEVGKRRQAEAILQARFRLSDYGLTHSLDELLTKTLDEAEALTGSTLGFFHFVEADQRTIALQTWSTNTKASMCTAAVPDQHCPIDRAGVWADCIRQRRPLAHNDYAALPGRTGLPEGHALVVRELVIPVFRGESIVCVLGVGNKPTDYVEQDLEAVSQLANMAWDIVTAKRASVEKAALERQLQQAQKMESVGRLAGGVAHDFNNMLGAILGHAELAMDQAVPETPLYEDLAEIQSAARRSADLTRQLLAFARRQTVARRVLDLNATVEGMLKMLQRLIGEQVRLVWRPGAELWPVKIDPSQVDQLLANLCINARDAIGDFGAVTIETSNATLDEVDCASDPGFVPGEYVRLVVADDGCGMDKETLSHLFEPFFTTKALGTGTGLGLATVYGAVKQNDGEIRVESEPGRGTTLTIYLPRHTGAGARVEPGATPVSSAAPPHETILLVEDEPAILRMTAKHLQKQGFAVLGAGSPEEALRKAREHVGEIHLLLSDVVMPAMNGRDLAAELRASFPRLKRLFMSGYTADVIAHHGVVDGGVNFLQKPFSRADLLAKVRAVLDAKDG